MIAKDVIEYFKVCKTGVGTCDEALGVAVEALEKQIPKKGIMIGDNYSSVLSCPKCRKPITNVWNIAKYEPNYCHYCGQALDWSDTK